MCKVCKSGNPEKTIISHGKLLEGCESCLPKLIQQGDSAKYYREWQKKEYRKELTQPNDTAYAKAYAEDFRKKHGDELYRKYG